MRSTSTDAYRIHPRLSNCMVQIVARAQKVGVAILRDKREEGLVDGSCGCHVQHRVGSRESTLQGRRESRVRLKMDSGAAYTMKLKNVF